ncbi:MAG: endonuclease/exonuclease/phosphatase family protein, partial [Lentisphaeria bacterium]|nr:endonuclease/exonuclease/phosphatase family protein [Lentisphaeria bacterium]
IQAPGHVSPLNHRPVVVEGVVTAVVHAGAWLQSITPDDSPLTSEAVFITAGVVGKDALQRLQVGDRLRVGGTVREIVGKYNVAGLPVTSIVAERIGHVAGSAALPAPIVVGRHGRVPPHRVVDNDSNGQVDDTAVAGQFDPAEDGVDFWESLEGMRIQVDAAVAIDGVWRRQTVVVGDGGEEASGLNKRGALVTGSDDANPERLVVELPQQSSPSLAIGVGYRFTAPLIGVLHYDRGAFKLIVTDPLPPGRFAEPPVETTKLRGAADYLTVATFNVLNLHPGSRFKAGGSRVDRVARAIAENLGGPDIVALQEIQDDSGPANDGVVEARRTAGRLLAALQPLRYDYCELPPIDLADGGQPGGNIRSAFLYRTDRVRLISRGHPQAGRQAGILKGPRLSASPGRAGTREPAFRDSRKPLVAEFEFNGQRLFLFNCHLKSKRGDSPLFGRHQPRMLASERIRLQQVRLINGMVQELLEQRADAKVIVLGDLNDFTYSDSLQVLCGEQLTNLTGNLPAPDRYSYIYQGSAELIDHVLVSSALLGKGADVDIVHMNCEFPTTTQVSDHDPVVVRLHVPRPSPLAD